MSIISTIRGRRGKSGFGHASTAEEVSAGVDLRGKVFAITGCNSGIGKESARVLALRGATLVALARSENKARDAVAEFSGDHIPVACELGDLPSVVRAAELVGTKVDRIDAIICNAGIMGPPRLKLVEGYESQFFVNHIGHACLVSHLLDLLADNGRVVCLSSWGHNLASRSEGIEFGNLDGSRGYSKWRFYGQSKLANLLFARELGRRFEGTKRSAHALHPGVIRTDLTRHLNSLMNVGYAATDWLFTKNVAQGAATTTYVACHPDVADQNRQYWSDCNHGKMSKHAQNDVLAGKLWERTEQIVSEVLGKGESDA